MKAFFFSIVTLAAWISISAGGGMANPPSNELEGHRTSLNAVVAFRDGTTEKLTLDGVGCTASICSRVKVRDRDNSVWRDGLVSVQNISHGPGVVTATFAMKNGTKQQAKINVANRVLYVTRDGRTKKLDLGTLDEITFLN